MDERNKTRRCRKVKYLSKDEIFRIVKLGVTAEHPAEYEFPSVRGRKNGQSMTSYVSSTYLQELGYTVNTAAAGNKKRLYVWIDTIK